ncbi:MAG TPA: XdhC family protein [Gaiellaceae bacterium]|nr:XdhC family protein [Gaiellaceae bacterium]
MSLADALLEVARGDERAVLFTVLDGPARGRKLLVRANGATLGDAPAGLAGIAAGVRRSGIVEHDGVRVFADVYGPPPRLVVVGAVDTGEALCAAARALGWHTVCVDARPRFATPERVPSAEEIVVAWPDEAFARLALDRETAVVVLTHDDRFDVPALAAALRSDAFYVGALGSRAAQANRRERLRDAGVTDGELARLHGPAGLDVGAESPAETAVSIIAEALAVRAHRDGGPLRASAERIHAER